MMRRGLAGVALAAAVALAGPAGASAARGYFSAPFTETTHTPAFGQAPVFVPNTNPQLVVFGQDYKTGDKNQVYVQRFDGKGPITCLTCKENDPVASDPNNVNGVPAVSPDGRWIIFHSWRGHYMTIGSPGYGGMGSALWALSLSNPKKQYQISDVQAAGATPGNGEGIDDYHAYWSPDGKHIEYAHLNWNFVDGGGSSSSNAGHGTWDVRVADFNVGKDGVPFLTHTDRIVRPDNGHWYETQWWNPNPRTPGFLYTESYPEANSGGGASIPQLFYCKLVQNYSKCDVTRLSDNASWDEQAIFTPDSKNVIFMSSRARDGIFNTWANLTRTAGVPADYDYLLILPVFEAGFLQPVGQESTDLYETSLAHPEKVRRLTHDGDDGWITPEFTWDPTNSYLMWTENRFPDGYRYQLPQGPAGWAQQLQDLAAKPPDPNKVVDVNQNGVGVAPLPVEQRTQIGVFDLGVKRHRARSPRAGVQGHRIHHARR
jgi:WD40 repeat protein